MNLGNPDSVSRTTQPLSVSGLSYEEQQYQHYQAIIEANQGKFKDGPGERNILAFRQETNTHAEGNKGAYDDITVMLWQGPEKGPDGQLKKHVKVYASNTEPNAGYQGRMGVDANHDGSLDLGRMPAGVPYEFKKDWSDHLHNVLRPVGSIEAERDTDRDGDFDEHVTASAGNSMLFHAGGNNSTGSAGCQTMKPGDFDDFWKNLEGAQGNISYLIVDWKGDTKPLPKDTQPVAHARTGAADGPMGGGDSNRTQGVRDRNIRQYGDDFDVVLKTWVEDLFADPEFMAWLLSQPEFAAWMKEQNPSWKPGDPVTPEQAKGYLTERLGADAGKLGGKGDSIPKAVEGLKKASEAAREKGAATDPSLLSPSDSALGGKADLAPRPASAFRTAVKA